MSDLTQFKCVPCRGGEPTVTDAELVEFAPLAPDWQIVERDRNDAIMAAETDQLYSAQ